MQPPTYLTTVISASAVILTAFLTYIFAKTGDRRKHYQDLRTTAYVDFVKSAAGIAIAQNYSDHAKVLESTILMVDAKTRISIYGSKKVISALANFFKQHGMLNNKIAYTAFVEIVEAMRAETPNGMEVVDHEQLGNLLFGLEFNFVAAA